ncbi:hypothetical protein TGVAND_239650 [Toxoplasma gondii VAND]|uniref:Uncharacterized protein n=2 Tax=Toxoplasma gondii TaxID=5811 RepID=A0A2G8XLC4_TOXGO|nr:hypothetical protein TGVAND_239650 [Toxoplasma gondii VAND]PIL95839.1 hypothetical protein TGCOUG_239650 [Toxoplasma gondii COUG]
MQGIVLRDNETLLDDIDSSWRPASSELHPAGDFVGLVERCAELDPTSTLVVMRLNGWPVHDAEQLKKIRRSHWPAKFDDSLTASHAPLVVEQAAYIPGASPISEGPPDMLLEKELGISVEHQVTTYLIPVVQLTVERARLRCVQICVMSMTKQSSDATAEINKADVANPDGLTSSSVLLGARTLLPPSRNIHNRAETVAPEDSVGSRCLAHEHGRASNRKEGIHMRTTEGLECHEFVRDHTKAPAPSVVASPLSCQCRHPATFTVVGKKPNPIKHGDKVADVGRGPCNCSSIENTSAESESKCDHLSTPSQEKPNACSKKRDRSQAQRQRQRMDANRPVAYSIEQHGAAEGRPFLSTRQKMEDLVTATGTGEETLTDDAMVFLFHALGERRIRKLYMKLKWDEVLEGGW